MNEEVCIGNTLSLSLIAKIETNLPFTLVKLVELHPHSAIGQRKKVWKLSVKNIKNFKKQRKMKLIFLKTHPTPPHAMRNTK